MTCRADAMKSSESCRLSMARIGKCMSLLARQGARLRNIRPAQKDAHVGRMFTLTLLRRDQTNAYHARHSQPKPCAKWTVRLGAQANVKVLPM